MPMSMDLGPKAKVQDKVYADACAFLRSCVKHMQRLAEIVLLHLRSAHFNSNEGWTSSKELKFRGAIIT